jgi:hypothetical protein
MDASHKPSFSTSDPYRGQASARKLVYQPYLFAISFVALLCKLAYSELRNAYMFDSLLWAFVAVFLVSSLLYYLEVRGRHSTNGTSVESRLETGKVIDSHMTAAEASKRDHVKVEIKTKDVKGSTLKGYEEKAS